MDTAGGAQLGERDGSAGFGEGCGDAFVHGRWRRLGLAALEHLEREGVAALGEFERDGGDRGRGAMLDGQGEIVAAAPKVEVRVAPRVKLGEPRSAWPAWARPPPFFAWWTTATATPWPGGDLLWTPTPTEEGVEERKVLTCSRKLARRGCSGATSATRCAVAKVPQTRQGLRTALDRPGSSSGGKARCEKDGKAERYFMLHEKQVGR